MSVLRQNNQTENSFAAFGDTTWAAQTFTVAVSHYIDKVSLKIKRTGTPGDFIVSIQGVDGNNKPDGVDLIKKTIDGNSISDSEAWVDIIFTSLYQLIAETQYAIVCRCPDAGASSIDWSYQNSDVYATGSYNWSITSGGSWTISAYDFAFKEYEGDVSSGVVPVDKTYSKKLVAIANNELWYESSEGTMSKLAASRDEIDCSNPLAACEAFGKIFIANGSNKKVADFTNVKLHTTDIQPTDKVYPRHGTVIEGGTSGAKMVVDYITDLDGDTYVYGQRITTATFVSGDVCTATIEEGSVSFTLDANEVDGPHWYNWTSYGNADGTDTTYGELPDKVTLVCNYRGRVMVSGDPAHPHQWYMPRQGNPWDWVYSSTDAQSAVAGNNCDMGEIGDVVVALIPYKDDYMAFGCANTTWYATGDPMEGGSLTELDLTTGIFGPNAHCWDGEGNLYFWGANGIYKTTVPGKPTCISQIRLPDLIDDVGANASTHRIVLAYDRKRVGVLICITKTSDGTNQNYWLDLRSEGFFPETYPEECGVFSAYYYEAINPDYQKLIIGCNDGYLRVFDSSAKDDDIGATDEAIDSYVGYGPIPLSDNPKYEGKIVELGVETIGGASGGSQSDSDDVVGEIFIAKSAEEALEKLTANTGPNFSGTITAPGRRRGASIKRKIKGMFACLRLGNDTASETWGLEQVWLDTKKSGKFK